MHALLRPEKVDDLFPKIRWLAQPVRGKVGCLADRLIHGSLGDGVQQALVSVLERHGDPIAPMPAQARCNLPGGIIAALVHVGCEVDSFKTLQALKIATASILLAF